MYLLLAHLVLQRDRHHHIWKEPFDPFYLPALQGSIS